MGRDGVCVCVCVCCGVALCAWGGGWLQWDGGGVDDTTAVRRDRMQVITGCRHRGAGRGGEGRGRDGGEGWRRGGMGRDGEGCVFDGWRSGELGLNGRWDVEGTGVCGGVRGGKEVLCTVSGINARVLYISLLYRTRTLLEYLDPSVFTFTLSGHLLLVL